MFRQVKQLMNEGETLAVATIVSTRGSTPRGIGAKMVVSASGEILGTVGGGCGEAEVRRAAVESIRSLSPTLVRVELMDDIECFRRPLAAGCTSTSLRTTRRRTAAGRRCRCGRSHGNGYRCSQL